jgi:hypothetical protein
MDMSELQILNVLATLGSRQVAGIAAGRIALGKLVSALPPPPANVLVDLTGIELVTASAFREAFVPLVKRASEEGRNLVFVNADPLVREEAMVVAEQKELVLVFAKHEAQGVHDAIAVGPLEEKLATAFRIVLELGEADARQVSERSGEDTVTTAWNNRLVALYRMGLLSERRAGKTKFYKPIIERMSYGLGFHP